MQILVSLLSLLIATAEADDAQTRAGSQPRSIPVSLQGGFWFGSFKVGNSRNLSLLLDTGSPDLIINPGLYKPSKKSINLNFTTEIDYGTAQSDGCGFADIKFSTFADRVTVAGYTLPNQTFGTVIATPPPNNSTITQFPGQGILGLMGVKRADTVSGGVPFFQHLCNRKIVPECRFGLALGTKGKGNHVIGGIDTTLATGPLYTTPLNDRFEWVVDGRLDPALKIKQTKLQQHFILDVGTSNVIGNRNVVQALFKKLGIQPFEQNLPGCETAIFGSYPCDRPPTVSFQVGNSSQVYPIEPSAFKLQDDGNNSCTATIVGADDYPGWILGQSWMQGKYLDFNAATREFSIGFLA